MAATMGALTFRSVRTVFRDVLNEELTKTTDLDGAVADADLTDYLDHLDALSNAGMVKTTVGDHTEVTGLTASGTSAIERNVSNVLSMTFFKAHPLNAAKEITKTVFIPAYISALQEVGTNAILIAAPGGAGTGSPAARLRAIVDFLEDSIDYEAVDGVHYPGGWTFDQTRSGFITLPNLIDGS